MNVEHEIEMLYEQFRDGLLSTQSVVNIAVTWLKEDMEFYPAYDPFNQIDYNDKNIYFYRANRLGIRILNNLHPSLADLYYRAITDTILKYERDSGKRLNKGMAYANLGIAQVAQGKFDAGIAHLLTAEWEDREVAKPRQFILDSPLWWQFEQRVFGYLAGYNDSTGIDFLIDYDFLTKLVKGLEHEDRIFFEGTILSLIDNLSQHKMQPNNFTYGRLYAHLKDLCLLIESLLRKKCIRSGDFTESEYFDLSKLLKKSLTEVVEGYPQSDLKSFSFANNLQDFLNNIELIAEKAKNPPIKWFYSLVLVRNFTGHHFDIRETIISKSGKTFFSDLYSETLNNLMLALLYLEHIDAI